MRARIAASVVLAFGVVLGTAGCGFIVPQSTTMSEQFDSGDGINGEVADVSIADALLISKDGDNANLVTTLVNHDSKSHRLAIQHGTGDDKTTVHVTVPPNDVKKLGEPGKAIVILKNIDTMPGSLYPVYFQYGDHPGERLLLPVLNGKFERYSDLTPAKLMASHEDDIITD